MATSEERLEQLSRKELKKLCKRHAIYDSGLSTGQLRSRLQHKLYPDVEETVKIVQEVAPESKPHQAEAEGQQGRGGNEAASNSSSYPRHRRSFSLPKALFVDTKQDANSRMSLDLGIGTPPASPSLSPSLQRTQSGLGSGGASPSKKGWSVPAWAKKLRLSRQSSKKVLAVEGSSPGHSVSDDARSPSTEPCTPQLGSPASPQPLPPWLSEKVSGGPIISPEAQPHSASGGVSLGGPEGVQSKLRSSSLGPGRPQPSPVPSPVPAEGTAQPDQPADAAPAAVPELAALHSTLEAAAKLETAFRVKPAAPSSPAAAYPKGKEEPPSAAAAFGWQDSGKAATDSEAKQEGAASPPLDRAPSPAAEPPKECSAACTSADLRALEPDRITAVGGSPSVSTGGTSLQAEGRPGFSPRMQEQAERGLAGEPELGSSHASATVDKKSPTLAAARVEPAGITGGKPEPCKAGRLEGSPEQGSAAQAPAARQTAAVASETLPKRLASPETAYYKLQLSPQPIVGSHIVAAPSPWKRQTGYAEEIDLPSSLSSTSAAPVASDCPAGAAEEEDVPSATGDGPRVDNAAQAVPGGGHAFYASDASRGEDKAAHESCSCRKMEAEAEAAVDPEERLPVSSDGPESPKEQDSAQRAPSHVVDEEESCDVKEGSASFPVNIVLFFVNCCNVERRPQAAKGPAGNTQSL